MAGEESAAAASAAEPASEAGGSESCPASEPAAQPTAPAEPSGAEAAPQNGVSVAAESEAVPVEEGPPAKRAKPSGEAVS